MKKRTVLITGARAPVALEGARQFHAAGWRVLGADSMPEPLASWSKALARPCRVIPALPEPSSRISRSTAPLLATLAEAAAWVTGKEPSLTKYSAGVLADSQMLDITAARRELGDTPEVPLDEGVRRFVEWWKAGARYPFHPERTPFSRKSHG